MSLPIEDYALVGDGEITLKARAHEASGGVIAALTTSLPEHDAIAQFERATAARNDLGLLLEEYNVPASRLSGNFPQMLTHLALINTALGLSGPVLDRGGA